MISGLAIVCVRNEHIHIRRCLRHLIEGGMQVRLIDNGSDDGTRELAESFLGSGLLDIQDLPWTGRFSLSDQLEAKARIIGKASQDWILHADADEWLISPEPGQTLLQGLDQQDALGYNLVNFHEAVFLPLPGEDFYDEDYASQMTSYYFFQPSYPRLTRAWRREMAFDVRQCGGHLTTGDGVRRSPTDFILRHYIALSADHARRKYVGRRFAVEDIDKGWHANRTIITDQTIALKHNPNIRRLDRPSSRRFDFTAPVSTHFWQW